MKRTYTLSIPDEPYRYAPLAVYQKPFLWLIMIFLMPFMYVIEGQPVSGNQDGMNLIMPDVNDPVRLSFPLYQTIASGGWSNPSNWQGGLVPNSVEVDALILHDMQVNGNFTVHDVTISIGKTLTIVGTNKLTIASGGKVVNNGTLAESGYLVFAGDGSIANKANLHAVELNGVVDLKGSRIGSGLKIQSGGAVAPGPMPEYKTNAALIINTGGPYTRGYEWTPERPAADVVVSGGTFYTLCDPDPLAVYSTTGSVVVQQDSRFYLDPLCGGDAGAAPGPDAEIPLLTIGSTLSVEYGGNFIMQNGDTGSLTKGTRFILTVNGDVLINGSLNLNSNIGDDMIVKGHWVRNGIFSSGENSAAGEDASLREMGRAVIFKGTAPQYLTGTGTHSFSFLVVDNPAGIATNINTQVMYGLNLVQGKFNLGGKRLSLGINRAISTDGGGDDDDNGDDPEEAYFGRLFGGHAGSYLFDGTFQRLISNKPQPVSASIPYVPNLQEACIFPIGSPEHYRPLTVTYTHFPNKIGMLNATHTAGINVVTGNKPNLTDSDGLLITEHYPDAYWTLWPTSSLDFDGSVYNIAYTCTNGMVGLSQPDKIRAIRRTGSAAQYQWELAGTYVPTTGDNQSPTVARNGLTGYSEFGLGYSPIVLPVNLTAFTGLRTTNGNLLRWSSSAEINFSHYGLQQSSDARPWTEIAKMNGRGGNFSQDYSFTHAKATGINHYRLRMVDLDGSARFSHIVTIRGSEPVTGVVTAVYERATGHILLQSNGGVFAQGTQARVTDVHGRMLTQMALPQTNRAVLGTGYLPGGVYLIQLQEANNRQVLKVFAE